MRLELLEGLVLEEPKKGLLDRKKAAAKGSSDNFQTPPEAIRMLLDGLGEERIEKKSTIWDPCCGEGLLVEELKRQGFNTIGTDIQEGVDFLDPSSTDTYRDFEYIITNPPYSLKDDFLFRCYELGRPFALLMPITALGEQFRLTLYKQHGIQVILPPKRINFKTPSGKGKGSWFYTAWFTHGFDLENDLVFV
jgi:hypothetical protein